MSAGAQPGNQFGIKLKDPEIRQRAYLKFCEWLAKGKSKDSFTFKEGEFKCTWRTLQKYIDENPHEFQPIHREFAFCEGYAHWEEVVEQSAKGENEKANTASLQMVMRNKYGWDKREKDDATSENKDHVKQLVEGLLNEAVPSSKKRDHLIEQQD